MCRTPVSPALTGFADRDTRRAATVVHGRTKAVPSELTLPGYDQLVQVGEGGLGRVYRATRISTGGTVAIKELRDVSEASPVWHRALREVEAMLRLKGHPNVVSVEEILPGPNGPCIVMEYLVGGSLHDRIREVHLSVPEVVLVGQEVASALLAAHALGVIHRDVKPHNLLVSGFGHAKVADFGIAALVRDSGVRTQTQSLTLAYASPEELDGAIDVGPPTDVYSLAATLAHLTTGVKPSFRDRTLSTLPFDHEPALALISQTLRRSLAIEPEHRPTMADFAAVFDDAQTRLGGRRLANLLGGAAAEPPPAPPTVRRTMGRSESTAMPTFAEATRIRPSTWSVPSEPPPPMVPVPAGSSAPGTQAASRTGLIAAVAAVATLALVGLGYLVLGGSSPRSATPATSAAAAVVPTGVAATGSAAPTEAPSVTTTPILPPLTVLAEPTTSLAAPTTIVLTTIAQLDPVAAASAELQRLIAFDRPSADSLVGQYVPQLSAKYVGLVYSGITYGPVEILADHVNQRRAYGAILVDSSAFAFEFDGGPMIGWYLSIVPVPYPTKEAATQWCTDHGLGNDDCFGREFKAVR